MRHRRNHEWAEVWADEWADEWARVTGSMGLSSCAEGEGAEDKTKGFIEPKRL